MSKRSPEELEALTRQFAEAAAKLSATSPVSAESEPGTTIRRSFDPFFKDVTEEEAQSGTGFTLMGPSLLDDYLSAASSSQEPPPGSPTAASGLQKGEEDYYGLPPPPQRANFNTQAAFEEADSGWKHRVAPILQRRRSQPR